MSLTGSIVVALPDISAMHIVWQIDFDECASTPCLNGASCLESTTSVPAGRVPMDAFECTCVVGYGPFTQPSLFCS
jgi:hypothetical protein